MPISVSRLRRWIAAALVFVCLLVAGVYFYARRRIQNTLKQVPQKMGIEIQQSANGFTISKSEQGRTLFKLQASKAVQFKSVGGRVELHDVAITIYGRDSARFDQVYGKMFEYDPQSGNVTSQGEVQIDLEANPEGALNSDQAPPKELKNPIHLKTTNLVFNKNTGDSFTSSEIDFSVPQASGSATGASYEARAGVLTFRSEVKIELAGPEHEKIFAERAVVEKNPREILLQAPRAESAIQRGRAKELTLYLRPDNTLDHATAVGDVELETRGAASAAGKTAAMRGVSASTVTSQKLDLNMNSRNSVQNAVLSGDVHFKSEGTEGWAGRAVEDFRGRNVLTKIHADERVRLLQTQGGQQMQDARGRQSPQKQNLEITAPAMDFLVAGGNRLTHAETFGVPQISLLPTDAQSGSTVVTADKFTAAFDSQGQISRVHGEAHARIVTKGVGQNGAAEPDRVSTSDSIDGVFAPGGGIHLLTQQGHFAYTSGTQQAFADQARYTPADQMVALSGSPRALDAGIETTAQNIRLNRATGEAYAQGDVKTSYNDLKAQPNGALLASSDPIHVTAQKMTARGNAAIATYSGNARLWQNANVIEAPVIEFQKEQRTVIARSDAAHKVSTLLVGSDKGKATPVDVTASRMVYRDADRRAEYDGGVTVRSSDLTITAKQMDVYLAAASSMGVDARRSINSGRSTNSNTQESAGSAKLDKIVANGSVLVTQPNRRATGDQLTYTASDDKFVLTGGPPSIFDAEHGKITGVSLTLFRRDDRVVVEGDSRSPAVTQTRMER